MKKYANANSGLIAHAKNFSSGWLSISKYPDSYVPVTTSETEKSHPPVHIYPVIKAIAMSIYPI